MARRNSGKKKEREKTTTGSEKEKCSCKVPKEIIQRADLLRAAGRLLPGR